MNLSNYYWGFPSALPPRLCDDIIKYALSKSESMARTGGYDHEKSLSQDQIKNMQRKENRFSMVK